MMNSYQRLIEKQHGSWISGTLSGSLTFGRDLLVRLHAFLEEHQTGTVVLLFLLALAVRLGWLGLWGFQAGDTALYIGIGRSIAEGEGFSFNGQPTAFVTPLYPVFLAFLFRLVGENLLIVQLVQVVLSALTVVLVYLLSRHLFSFFGGATAGAIAGLIVALHPWLIFWSGYILTETLFVFLFTGAVLSFIYAMTSPSLLRWLTSGALLGLATLCRPMAFGLFLLALVLWPILFPRSSLRQRYTALGVFLISCFIVLAPWGVRNYLTFQAVVPFSTEAGTVFYSGNNPLVSSLGGGTHGLDFELPPEAEGMDEIERNSFMRNLAFQYIREHPRRFISNATRRLYLYWSPEFPTYSLRHNLGNYFMYLPFYAAALWGLLITFREQWRPALLLALIFGYFTALHMITIVDWDQRFRLPLQPFLSGLAGVGLAHLVNTFLKKRTVAQGKAVLAESGGC